MTIETDIGPLPPSGHELYDTGMNFEQAAELCPFLGRAALESPEDFELMRELYQIDSSQSPVKRQKDQDASSLFSADTKPEASPVIESVPRHHLTDSSMLEISGLNISEQVHREDQPITTNVQPTKPQTIKHQPLEIIERSEIADQNIMASINPKTAVQVTKQIVRPANFGYKTHPPIATELFIPVVLEKTNPKQKSTPRNVSSDTVKVAIQSVEIAEARTDAPAEDQTEAKISSTYVIATEQTVNDDTEQFEETTLLNPDGIGLEMHDIVEAFDNQDNELILEMDLTLPPPVFTDIVVTPVPVVHEQLTTSSTDTNEVFSTLETEDRPAELADHLFGKKITPLVQELPEHQKVQARDCYEAFVGARDELVAAIKENIPTEHCMTALIEAYDQLQNLFPSELKAIPAEALIDIVLKNSAPEQLLHSDVAAYDQGMHEAISALLANAMFRDDENIVSSSLRSLVGRLAINI